MAGFHSKVSPSSFERVLLCPGSVALCATVPESKPTEFAAEGTVFHRLVGFCLQYGFEPWDFEDTTHTADGFAFVIEDEMVEHMITGLDRLRSQLPDALFIETRVKLDKWLPDQSGTLDVGGYNEEYIHIWDWKYGAGVAVHPFKNPQLMLYALGFWDQIARHKTKARKFRLWIEQPRNPAGGGDWEVDLDYLLQFGKKARRVLDKALSKNAELVAGEKQCMWCPAKGKCPAYDKFSLEVISAKFEDLDGSEPPDLSSKMTLRRRAYVARYAGMLKDWIDEQHKIVLDAARKGDDTFMVKVVEGRRGRSKWADETTAIASLMNRVETASEIYTAKLISPAQAKKKLGATVFHDLIEARVVIEGEPKPILVPIDDPRPALQSVASKFDDLTGEDSGKRR